MRRPRSRSRRPWTRSRATRGYINLLIVNLGVVGLAKQYDPSLSIRNLCRKLFNDMAIADLTQTFDVNLTGAYFTMLVFLELLKAGNKNAFNGGFGAPNKEAGDVPLILSQVIFARNVSSYSRHISSPPAYTGCKAAIAHMAKHASTQLAKYEIRVNVMAPAIFPFDQAQGLMLTGDPSKESYDDPRITPSRRFASDEEMGGILLYLGKEWNIPGM
ncbi:hypothetical protein DL768_002670 [Monosporascus sp. mg162]|nr:hypothetical protein DL768_002670 [Monosporascus sp. mg162]